MSARASLVSLVAGVSALALLAPGCSSKTGEITACLIQGVAIPDGTLKDQNPCQVCTARANPLGWSSVAVGIRCGQGGGFCSTGTCKAGCYIDATFYPPGRANPANSCLDCQPAVNPTSWSPVTGLPPKEACPAGDVCAQGRCQPGCTIGAAQYAAGSQNPDNPCQACRPEQQTTGWTDQPPGSPCADGGAVCATGICTAGCEIAGVFYHPGYPSPESACMTCQPGLSTATFSPVTGPAPGGTCGSSAYCFLGQCSRGCSIDGTSYGPSDLDPQNACRACLPTTSATTWSDLDPGAPCGVGVCRGGVCLFGCEVDGVLFPPNKIDPGDVCRSCQPAQNPTGWSPLTFLPDFGCAGGQVCLDGGCRVGCYIDKTFRGAGDRNPADVAQCCIPSQSPANWGPAFDEGAILDPMGFGITGAYGTAAPTIAAADFNGDGQRDLAFVVNNTYPAEGLLAIYLGQPDGGFSAPVTKQLFSSALATEDLDGDGLPDLVLSDATGFLSVVMSRADGGFSKGFKYASNIPAFDAGTDDGGLPVTYAFHAESSIALADFNGDGRLDAALSGGLTSTDLGVLFGIGDGGFQSGVAVASGVYDTHLVQAADFNNDGAPDLLLLGDTSLMVDAGTAPVVIYVSTDTPKLNLLMNDGTGGFSPPVAISGVLGDAVTFVVSDFNGDGKPDIAVAWTTPYPAFKYGIQVFLGLGDGGFQSPSAYGPSPAGYYYSGGSAGQLVVGDFNGDGHPDLFLTGYARIWMNLGDGSFSTDAQGGYLPVFGQGAQALDLSGDGLDDLVVFSGSQLQLWFNNCH